MEWVALSLQSGDTRAAHGPYLSNLGACMLSLLAWSCAEIRCAEHMRKFPTHGIVQATTGYIWVQISQKSLGLIVRPNSLL